MTMHSIYSKIEKCQINTFMARNYLQGMFRPKHPEKYKGDPTKIVFRSSWELKVFRAFDENKNVIEWGSEEVVIIYQSPVDGKLHRYFVDCYAKIRTKNNEIKKLLIEIKPFSQTIPPVLKNQKKKTYLNECMTYSVNDAKWKAASYYCKERGWEFKIMTEKDIYG